MAAYYNELGLLLMLIVANHVNGRDLDLAPGGSSVLSRIKTLDPSVPCQAYTATLRSAIASKELLSETECIGIVNDLRASPPTPEPENLDEKCKKSMEDECRGRGL